jgi:circadian clock protein KaiB
MEPSADQAARAGSRTGEFLDLRLYIVGKLPNSARARANLEAICQKYLVDNCYKLEIVDILKDPLRAVRDKVLVTPTLVKLGTPLVMIVGDLSQEETVLRALGLQSGTW